MFLAVYPPSFPSYVSVLECGFESRLSTQSNLILVVLLTFFVVLPPVVTHDDFIAELIRFIFLMGLAILKFPKIHSHRVILNTNTKKTVEIF